MAKLFLIHCNCNSETAMILTSVSVTDKATFKTHVSYLSSLNRLMHWYCSKENFSWLRTHFTPSLLSTQNRAIITVELFCWKYEFCHLKRYNLVIQCMNYYLDWVTCQSSLSLKQISNSSYFRKYENKHKTRKLRVCTLWFLPEVEWNSILTCRLTFLIS